MCSCHPVSQPALTFLPAAINLDYYTSAIWKAKECRFVKYFDVPGAPISYNFLTGQQFVGWNPPVVDPVDGTTFE